MKKRLILTVTFLMLFLPGCVTANKTVDKTPAKVSIWWGTKEEIKTFLDSPSAQAKRWVVESIGD